MSTEQEHAGTEHAESGGFTTLPFFRLPEGVPVRSLDDVLAVCRFLADFPGLWWVGGGWAIDVWAGRPSREHEDVEICVLRRDQAVLKAYCAGWQSFTPVNDQWAAMAEGELLESPHSMWQLRSTSEAPRPDGMPSEFEFILNDVVAGNWVFQPIPSIQIPIDHVYGPSPLGIPVTTPEILLLHKSWHHHRPKDGHDFQCVRHLLGASRRTWLREQLELVRPDDPWLAHLRGED